jgi:sugar lactone lactonase YvrE
MQKAILLIFTAFLLNGCTPSPKDRKLTEVFKDDYQFTGVAISKTGRMFVNYPRWSDHYEYGVAEIKKGKKIPFPDMKWNAYSGLPIDYFLCVQSVYVDKNDNLWILDTGNPEFKGVVYGGAKLVRIDLRTNKILLKYFFNEPNISKNSYLNDVRIDENNNKAYITDSGAGGIIVLDTDSGKQRKLLSNHVSTMAEPGYVIKVNGKECLNTDGKSFEVQSDGLTLDAENKYLYFHALSGKALYKVPTKLLNDENVSDVEREKSVEKVADTGAVDGILSSDAGNVFLTALEENSIKYLTPKNEIKTLVKDKNLWWPDTLSIGPDKYLYVTDSMINEMPFFNSGKDERKGPYKIYKINVSDLCKGTFFDKLKFF